MKGVVFTEFVDWAESVHGLEVVDAVLARASTTPEGAYTAASSYDWREFVGLVQALAMEVGVPVGELLRAYGQHLFGVLVASYPGFTEGVDGSLALLERVESIIHPEVRKLYPDAELPRFSTERTPDGLRMTYTSPRPFRDFARGLIEGCITWFADGGEITCSGAEQACEFTVSMPQEAR
jgi:hypothetical protein